MPRTFYNLCDVAAVEDRRARSIAGHASQAMADRYRTPAILEDQQRELVGKLLQMADYQRKDERKLEEEKASGGEDGGETTKKDGESLDFLVESLIG